MSESTPSRTPLKPIKGNESGRRFGGFRPSRRDQNLAKMENVDKSYKGADEDFGTVMGLSNELPHLTHGKVCGEFQDALLIYVQSKYDRGGDLRPLILDLKDPKTKLDKSKPKYNVVPGSSDEIEQTKTWEMKWKHYMNRQETMEENVEKLFGLLMGQCTQALVAEVKASPEYAVRADNSDSLWLLKKMKILSAGVDNQVNKVLTYHEKLMDLSKIFQGPVESLDDYRTRFTAAVMTVEMTGGESIFQPFITTNTTSADIIKTKDKVMAMWFLLHSDKVRFGPFLS